MHRKINLENVIRRELEMKAYEVEISDKVFSRIINRIESYEGGSANMLKDRISNFVMKSRLAVSLCLALALVAAVCTFSDGARAAALNVVNAVKTVFVVDKVDGEYKLVEKPADYPYCTPIVSRGTTLNDKELSDKYGFNVFFPETLYGEYKRESNAELVGIKMKVNEKTMRQLQKDMFEAIDNDAAFEKLREYKPYRMLSSFYVNNNNYNRIFIDMWASDASEKIEDGGNVIKTKVGDADADWIDSVYPDYSNMAEGGMTIEDTNTIPEGIVKSHALTWYSEGIMYYIGTVKGTELAMEDAVKIAESFMETQK